MDYRLQTRGDRSLPDLRSVELSSELTAVAGRVDVFLAGPPCEGNSNLNNRTRRVDDRNELYLDAVVAGIAVGARVIVVENVPAVKRSRRGWRWSDVRAWIATHLEKGGGTLGRRCACGGRRQP